MESQRSYKPSHLFLYWSLTLLSFAYLWYLLFILLVDFVSLDHGMEVSATARCIWLLVSDGLAKLNSPIAESFHFKLYLFPVKNNSMSMTDYNNILANWAFVFGLKSCLIFSCYCFHLAWSYVTFKVYDP